jgi:hypothetical protein
MKDTTELMTRFKLPARIRRKPNTTGDFDARIALADRIAGLPGIETIERNDDSESCRIDIYLRNGRMSLRPSRKPALLFCSLERSDITVSGLDRWTRHQVLSRGWGQLVGDAVCVTLPRDAAELETVWSIVQQAHGHLFDASTPEPGAVRISTWDLPKFSRTSLH